MIVTRINATTIIAPHRLPLVAIVITTITTIALRTTTTARKIWPLTTWSC